MARALGWQLMVSVLVWGSALGVCEAQPVTTRVSVDATGTEVAGASRQPGISADGRFVAFSSTATTLVAGDTNGSADIFVKDRQTGAVTRVSVRTDGTQQTGDSVTPDVSSDGRYVTFVSAAALVADDTNSNQCFGAAVQGPTCPDVYVHDRSTGATTRVSIATDGGQGDGASAAPKISADGRYVVFESSATTLAPDIDHVVDVYLRNRQTNTTTRVSVSTTGEPSDFAAFAPTISDDGTRIVFLSSGARLDPSPDPLPCEPTILSCLRAYVRAVGAGTTARVPLIPVGGPFNPVAQAYRVSGAVISGDGDTVAMLVYGLTPGATPPSSVDTVATYSLATGERTSGFLGSTTFPLIGTARWSHVAISRSGRTIAACYLGFSAAANTYGVVIRDVLALTGATAAGSNDPGGYLAAQPDCEGVALSDDGNITFLASSGTQIVDGDTNAAMDVFVQDRDTDRDGMPAEWESAFGFNASDPADAGLDPDSDGVTNRQEFDAATHPRGLFTYYLAEGVRNAFFSTEIAVFKPLRSPDPQSIEHATIVMRFYGEDGRRRPNNVLASLSSPESFPAGFTLTDVPEQSFSTVIESDRLLAVERTVTWGGGVGAGYGSHAETATTGPSATAYFAEGATHGAFDLFYLLQNPASVPVTATITYLRPAPQAPIVRTYTLLPNSRRTIWVDQEPGLEATDVSARIEADRPIFAERSMYLSTPSQPFAGGTSSAAVTTPATQWFIAEGATGAFFDLFLLIGNPSPGSADVTVTYLLPDGTSIVKSHQVAGQSRLTIPVKGEDARLAATAVSASITSTNATPIVVERAMWWPSPAWYEGAVTAATTTAAARWALAGGFIDNTRPDTETYLLVANPGATAANVTFDLGIEGHAASSFYPSWYACRVTVAVPAHGRYTTGLRDVCPFATAPYPTLRIAGTIESDGPPLVVERSTYWSAGGQFWAAGASTLLTPLP